MNKSEKKDLENIVGDKQIRKTIALPEDDIKYRGKLSYRHLRMLAWFIFGISALTIVFKVGGFFHPDAKAGLDVATQVISFFSSLPLPLFLVANFALFFQHRNNSVKLLKRFGVLMGGIYVVMTYVIMRYLAVMFMDEGMSYWESLTTIHLKLELIGVSLFGLNIFVDLFLFALSYFFLDYTPKKHFKKKNHLLIFRCFSFLPLIYIVVMMILKYQMYYSGLAIPFFLIPLFPSKSIMIFLAFFAIVIYMKNKEYKYIVQGGIKEEAYDKYLASNRSSLRFSAFVAIDFAITSIIDIGLAFIIALIFASVEIGYINYDAIMYGLGAASVLGFGGAGALIIMAPILFLFSYNIKYPEGKIDLLIPLAGIAFIVFVVIEGLFIVFYHIH